MRLSWVTAGFRSVVFSRFVEIEGMSGMSNAFFNNNVTMCIIPSLQCGFVTIGRMELCEPRHFANRFHRFESLRNIALTNWTN